MRFRMMRIGVVEEEWFSRAYEGVLIQVAPESRDLCNGLQAREWEKTGLFFFGGGASLTIAPVGRRCDVLYWNHGRKHTGYGCPMQSTGGWSEMEEEKLTEEKYDKANMVTKMIVKLTVIGILMI